MTDELKEALELAQPFLEEVSKAVEGGAKFSYDIILRQQYVKLAQTGLGWLLFILFIALPLWWCIKRLIRDVSNGWEEALSVRDVSNGWEEALSVCLGIIGIIFLIVLLSSTFEGIGILINPNYYVIQEVVKLLQTVGR